MIQTLRDTLRQERTAAAAEIERCSRKRHGALEHGL
jgi:hypothetical protein